MTTSITVDLSSPTPVYEQIRSTIAGAVASGELTAGDRLPTIRALAADLGIAVNTVARAYSELESSGLVETRRRVGTVIAWSAVQSAPDEIRAAVDEVASSAVAAGLTEAVMVDLLRSAIRRIRLG